MNGRKTPTPEPTVTPAPRLCLDCRTKLMEHELVFCGECVAKIQADAKVTE